MERDKLQYSATSAALDQSIHRIPHRLVFGRRPYEVASGYVRAPRGGMWQGDSSREIPGRPGIGWGVCARRGSHEEF